jgi:hypothetical protein
MGAKRAEELETKQEYLAAVHNVIRALLSSRETAEDWF